MYVRVGNLSLASGATEWATRTTTTFDARGLPAQILTRVDLKGDLLGTDTADIIRQSAALRTVCQRQFCDVLLVDDSGTILEGLRNATSLSGVRIVELAFPEGRGAEIVTHRTFTLSAEATYVGVPGSLQLVEVTQRVTKSGGGPVFSFLQPKLGKPVKVMDAAQTPFYATQQGSAVSLIPNPLPRPPIWPGSQIRAPEVTYDDPVFDGTRWRYGVSWSYTFGSANPLN